MLLKYPPHFQLTASKCLNTSLVVVAAVVTPRIASWTQRMNVIWVIVWVWLWKSPLPLMHPDTQTPWASQSLLSTPRLYYRSGTENSFRFILYTNFVCCLMFVMQQLSFKGPIHPRIRKIHIFLLTSRAVYPCMFFWCELLSLLWNIMELQSITLSLWCSPAMSLLRNDDPVAQDSPQTLFRTVSCMKYFLFYQTATYHCAKGSAHLWIILSNQVMISGRKHWCWIFQM